MIKLGIMEIRGRKLTCWHINSEFIPINDTGSASVKNSYTITMSSVNNRKRESETRVNHKLTFSILTASVTIDKIWSSLGLWFRYEKSRHAKSVCSPSSLEINSFENDNPGINPLFLSQKIEAKDPEKKMPSTQAKATNLSANVVRLSSIHRRAHNAFFWMQGTINRSRLNLNKTSQNSDRSCKTYWTY